MARRFIEEFDSGYHSKYLLYYHLVIVTKYRKKVLDEECYKIICDVFAELSREFNVRLNEMNGEGDHIHFLLSAAPQTDLPKFIGRLKGKSSYLIRRNKPDLMKIKALWSGSYCLLTTGGAPIDVIKRYIISQGNRRNYNENIA